MLAADFPPKAVPLFKPAPYKVMYGGRGGSKTWNFCRAALILASRRPLFVLFARELQKSINESVHRVLATQLAPLGMQDFYEVQSHRIIGKNGSQFVFAGIKNNINAIKSMEAIDLCAVIEANGVSAYSWDVLLPTVRRDPPHGPFGKGSEIWIEFNPELATDETYKRWVLRPPEGTFCEEVNWRDNPWFPTILEKQKEEMRVRDYENYLTVWEGQVRRVVSGAVYAKEIEAAQRDGRISPHITHDRSRSVDVAVDLGRADTCALWFVQQQGMQHHFIHYYSNVGYDWSHYLEHIQGTKYRIGRIYLPHDGSHKVIAAAKSVLGQTKDAYPNDGQVLHVERTPKVANDISQVRMLFQRFYFAEEKCADGLQALAHYRYKVDEEKRDPMGRGAMSPEPDHNWACVMGDTKVLTRKGLQSISTLPENGEVLTPCGWKKYHSPQITRRHASLVEVAFADGMKVNCTAEHLFLTASGWKRADALQSGTAIQSSLTTLRSISMAGFIGFGQLSGILRAEAATCISMFGNRCLESARMAFTFITETAIERIIGSATWNACPATNTCGLLINNKPLREKSAPLANLPEVGRQSGTNRPRAAHGISATPNVVSLGKNGSANRSSVANAIKSLWRWCAGTVWRTSSVPRFAKRALTVSGVRHLNRCEDVWCLTVDDGHWWTLANGAVTHNSHGSDALRCYVMGMVTHNRFVRPQIHQPFPLPQQGSVPMGQRWMS